MLGIGIGILLTTSNGWVAHQLLGRLEYRYPALDLALVQQHYADAPIIYVVVLGGMFTPTPDRPITSQINPPMLIRLIEGIRVYRALPRARLLLSGGGKALVTEANAMAELAQALGVPVQDIVLERESTSTYDEAMIIQRMIGNTPCILTTSARHMPRAMALFRRAGLSPIPAPTEHHAGRAVPLHWLYFLPRAEYLWMNTMALYEYVGLMKEKLLGRW